MPVQCLGISSALHCCSTFLLCCHRSQAKGGNTANSTDRTLLLEKENLEFGVMDVEMSGYNIRMTDMERSVCDAVKYRNKIGLEVCSEVIRNYLKKQNRNLSQLAEYAKRLRVANILKNYLEIAIE